MGLLFLILKLMKMEHLRSQNCWNWVIKNQSKIFQYAPLVLLSIPFHLFPFSSFLHSLPFLFIIHISMQNNIQSKYISVLH